MNHIKIFLWILLTIWISNPVFSKDKTVNIVFIGNSITQGVIINDPQKAPPAQAVRILENKKDISSVNFYNNGVSGSTTVDHLPQTGTLFSQTIKAADQRHRRS